MYSIVDLYYSQIIICKFSYLLWFLCNPKINTHSTFTVIRRHGCVQSDEKSVTPPVLPLRLELLGVALPSVSALVAVSRYSVCGVFNIFHVFDWLFCCLKAAPSTVPKCCLVSLSARRLCCALQRKDLCALSLVQAWIMVLLAISSMLMNQQYIY